VKGKGKNNAGGLGKKKKGSKDKETGRRQTGISLSRAREGAHKKGGKGEGEIKFL